MELLEIALKQSIAWSLSEHDELPFGKAVTKKSNDKLGSISKQLTEGVESANCELMRESQVRAFVSRFMIELNQLMDSLQEEKRSEGCHEKSDGSNRGLAATSNSSPEQERRQKKSARPTIEMNGKYSGVYNINGTQTTDDDEDFDETYLRHLQHVYGVLKEDQNWRQSSIRSLNSRRRSQNRNVVDSQQQVDDGYRSLSRDGSTTNAIKRVPKNSQRSVELMKQLNDIKSRVVDLVRQLDDIAAPKLEEEDMDAYRRRRDALVQKLDILIGRQTRESPPEDHANSSVQLTSADSSQSSSSDGYEEQVQVIDYDFKQRASDLGEIRRQRGSMRLKKSADVSLGKLVCNDGQLTTPLIDCTRNACTQIDFSSISSSRRSGKLFFDCPEEPIDFNAMMCDYERRKKAEQPNQPLQDSLHLPSSSSSSSGSNTSTTTSSYI